MMDTNYLNEYKVKEALHSVYYIPDFITNDEEDSILKKIYGAPKPKWTYLKNRRLQNYGGIPHSKGLIPEEIPDWLQILMNRVSDLNMFQTMQNKKCYANHCLINEYLPGQGIMPHLDGPVFFPVITTISLSSHTILQFHENNEGRKIICKLLLEPKSLLILSDEMYTDFLHSIDEITEDNIDDLLCNLGHCRTKYKVGDILKRSTRVSLTIRNIPNVIKIKFH